MTDLIDKVLLNKTLEELQPVEEKKLPNPEPTEKQLVQALDLLPKIEHLGGYGAIAKTSGVNRKVVKLLDKARKVKIAELTPKLKEESISVAKTMMGTLTK